MARPRRRISPWVSLGGIGLYWAFQLASYDGPPELPETFAELVLGVVLIKLLILAAIGLLLRLEGQGFAQLGFVREGWRQRLRAGLVLGVAMFVGFNVVLDSLMNALIPRSTAGGSPLTRFFADPWHLLAWLPLGVLGGGLVEELQRIFFLTRFEACLGRRGLILGVVLSSAMFGFGHLYQGVGTALGTAVAGAVFALVYLRRRSAVEPIIAHALSDVLAMLGATMLARAG